MATVYLNDSPALFHCTIRQAASGNCIHISGFCDRIDLATMATSLFDNGPGAPSNYRHDGDTFSFRRVGPADALPAKDQLAREMALAVLAGDMVAALALVDRLLEQHKG